MSPSRLFVRPVVAALAAVSLLSAGGAQADTTLLNVSYDVARELYKEINPAFVAHWQRTTGEKLTVNQSHGGSSKQIQSVIAGLEADVVTMNQAADLDVLAKSGLTGADWRKAFPNGAAPYTSATIFLVRKGNPKGIKDWDDLARAGVQVVIPNPKTSGNGRYTYLAAWGYALSKGGNDAKAREFVGKLFGNVPVFDGGGRGATTTFTQRGIGDVLVTFENEAVLIDSEVGGDKFDVVYPSLSIDASAPVAIVNKVVDKKGTRKQATAYLEYLWSKEGQENAAQNYLRPRDAELLKKYAANFPPVKTFTVDEVFGGANKAFATHFKDGGSFDQIYVAK